MINKNNNSKGTFCIYRNIYWHKKIQKISGSCLMLFASIAEDDKILISVFDHEDNEILKGSSSLERNKIKNL